MASTCASTYCPASSTFGAFPESAKFGSFFGGAKDASFARMPSTFSGLPSTFSGVPSTFGYGYPSTFERFGGYPSMSSYGSFPSTFERSSYPWANSTFGSWPSTYGSWPSTFERFGGYPWTGSFERFGGYPSTFGGYPWANSTFGSWPSTFGSWPSTFGGHPWMSSTYGACPWGSELAMFKSMDCNNGNLYTVGFRPSSAIEYYSLANPIRYMDREGSRMVWLCYELKGYKPEEITVTLNKAERAIIVEATHEVKEGKEHHVMRKFSRKFVLPESLAKVDLAKVELKSCLNVEGYLSVECLLPKMTAEELVKCPIMSKIHEMPMSYFYNFAGLNNYFYSKFYSCEGNIKPVTVKTA